MGSNPAPVAAAAAPPVASAAIPDIHVDSGAGDENWDDWDDDVEDSGPPAAAAAVPAAASAIPVASSDPNNFNLTSPSRRGSTTISRTGTIRKNINRSRNIIFVNNFFFSTIWNRLRFSSFVKSGGEAFVIGSVSLKIQLKSSDKLAIGLVRGPLLQIDMSEFFVGLGYVAFPLVAISWRSLHVRHIRANQEEQI